MNQEVWEFYSASSSDDECGDELQRAFTDEGLEGEAAEYLRKVRETEAMLPRVVVLKNRPVHAPVNPESFRRSLTGAGAPREQPLPECRACFLPDPVWERTFVSSFSAEQDGLKAKVAAFKAERPQDVVARAELPALEDEDGWWEFVSGLGGQKRKRGEAEEPRLPRLAYVARFEPVLVYQVLEYIANGIESFTNEKKEGQYLCIPKNILLWTYSLLLLLEKPILPETSSSIRYLF